MAVLHDKGYFSRCQLNEAGEQNRVEVADINFYVKIRFSSIPGAFAPNTTSIQNI